MPPAAWRSIQASIARDTAEASIGVVDMRLTVDPLPGVERVEQALERLHCEYDHHVTSDGRIAQAEARGDDQRITERVAVLDQTIDDLVNRVDVDFRHRERHRHRQQVSE